MSFLEKIFGKTKKEKKPVELLFSNADDFIKSQSAFEAGELEEFYAKKSSEIKHLLRQLSAKAVSLEQAGIDKQNKRVEKIVSTSRTNAVRKLSSLAERISPPPFFSPKEARSYSISSLELIRKEVESSWKNIAYSSVYLKEEIKEFGEILEETRAVLAEISEKFSPESKVFLSERAKILVSSIRDVSSKNLNAVDELDSFSEKISELEDNKKSLVASLEELSSSLDFKKFESLKENKSKLLHEKQELKSRLSQLLFPVEKPLKKFEKLVSVNKVSLSSKEESLLKEYLSNPLIAFKKDHGALVLKKILSALKEQIISGEISLKDKERDKKISAIEELVSFDFFENVFWKLNKVEAKLSETETLLRKNNVFEKSEKIEREIDSVEREILEKKSILLGKKKNASSSVTETDSLFSELESVLSKLYEGKVSLKQ